MLTKRAVAVLAVSAAAIAGGAGVASAAASPAHTFRDWCERHADAFR